MAAIWFNKSIKKEDINPFIPGTMSEQLGMEWQEIGDDFIKIKMPVDHRTKQAYGLLHGGASCTLAETVGSVASMLVVDPKRFSCVGLEINANHIRSARDGHVTGIAKPLHLGSSTHVWDVKIYDDLDRLICISRLTIAVLNKAF
ncbi:hotdog fold thioesterase [Ferruginibacter albus]|uniref:hotdog fold thioesterase n=1 Tax=Ferruginibacter albus TaxID=2875540 RepID=UPI001CC410F6|nr:hotdog fold thioesterase [Ferruginibacter albus]UAY53471.1 hotdog fold thioesterase [Ferruginibacter albus]